eukprot:c24692_g1_i1 orf=82-3981(+)
MIRLIVRTASCRLCSFVPASTLFCVRRLYAQTIFFTSSDPASQTSFPGTAPASGTSFSRRKSAPLPIHRCLLPAQFSSFESTSGFLSTEYSPPCHFFARRGLKSGFIARKKEALAEHDLSNLPLSLSSCDTVKEASSGEHRTLLHLNGSTTRSFRGWVGGATAAIVLLFSAFSFLKHEDNPTIFNESTLASAISEVRSSAMDIWTRITVIFDSVCTTLSTFLSKASEAATAMTVLVRCVNAVLFTKGEDYANELALRWRLRVISLLADLAGSSHSRRRALIQAGNGSVLDWLLEAVRHGELGYRKIQAEAARALSHFLSDDVTCEVVLGRPNALSQLLLFAASIQPNMSTKSSKRTKLALFLENDESTRGRSMLVAALMDIITSSCEIEKKGGIRPKLSGLANAKEISAALKVLQEASLCLDESHDESGDDNGDNGQSNDGVHGTGMNETSVAVQNQSLPTLPGPIWSFLSSWGGKGGQSELVSDFVATGPTNAKDIMERKQETASHGLWDDLHGSHVAVPLAAWAIATWAQASSANCAKIAKLDKDGGAILACVLAPERTVKWHGAIAARLVLENGFDEPAVAWSGALLETARQASKVEDAQLSLVALDSFYSCIRKSAQARERVSKNCLLVLRDISKQTFRNVSLQKVIAEILEILSFRGAGLSVEEGKKWSSILLYWLFNRSLEDSTHLIASRVLAHLLDELGPGGIPLSQVWLAMVIMSTVNGFETNPAKGDASVSKSSKTKGLVQGRTSQLAIQAANELAKAVWLSVGEVQGAVHDKGALNDSESEWGDLTNLDLFNVVGKVSRKDKGKLTAANGVESILKAMKALTELTVEDEGCQLRMIERGGLQLLRRFMLKDDYETAPALEKELNTDEEEVNVNRQTSVMTGYISKSKAPPAVQLRKYAAQLLSILSLQPLAAAVIKQDEAWCRWLEACADNQISGCNGLKTSSYARATLWNLEVSVDRCGQKLPFSTQNKALETEHSFPHYKDKVFIVNTDSPLWRHPTGQDGLVNVVDTENETHSNFEMDVVFVHGLCGGPFKTWRITDDKTSSTGKAGLVEKIDADSGRQGTCWPKEWLSNDIPACRLLTVKYKTNLSQWSGTTLPLQEVSAMLLEQLLAAGVGERPVVFITHSMGGLVVKQMLMQAWQDKKCSHMVKNTAGIVFYSCPHFGSKLADVPWRLGLVLRPAPSIGELRCGSARLEELNQFIRSLHKGGLEILSFSETKVTPLVEGYGGWALRMEVVPIESAYPGFGELVVLDGTDHVNSCKPFNRDDIAYTQTLQLLQKIFRSAKSSRP